MRAAAIGFFFLVSAQLTRETFLTSSPGVCGCVCERRKLAYPASSERKSPAFLVLAAALFFFSYINIICIVFYSMRVRVCVLVYVNACVCDFGLHRVETIKNDTLQRTSGLRLLFCSTEVV